MRIGHALLSVLLAASLAACGGGGGGGNTSSSGGNTGGGGTGGGGGGDGCSLSERQQFVLDAATEWYLFPSLLDTGVNPNSHATVQSYIDALVAPARDANRDKGFSFITSIAEENALLAGSSAGFGLRYGYDTVNDRVFVLDAYEDAPGFGAGMDRGTELLAIGTSSSTLQSVSTLMASGGPQAVVDALGPSDIGITRVIQFRTVAGVSTEVSLSKVEFTLDPISDRFGIQIIDDGGKKVGYLFLRTFIVRSASDQLRDAFAAFKAQGVTELIIDLRYNGGGLVSVAEVMGDLMGASNVGDVFSETVFRASKSSNDVTELFESEADAITPTKIAFVGSFGSASASELVMNSMIPYLSGNTALIGANTFGKPVGQSAFDLPACDDRLRLVTFQTNNADGGGEYYTGMASVMPNTCRSADDISLQFGDPASPSVLTALDFLAGRSCTAISGTRTLQGASRIVPLQPDRPNAAQHELPGLF